MKCQTALGYCRGKDAKCEGDKNVRMDLSCGPALPPSEGPEDTPFSTTVRNEFVRRAPLSLKSSMVALSVDQKL